MALSGLKTHPGNGGSRPWLAQGAPLCFFGQRVRRDCLGRRLLDQARRKHGTNRAGGILDLRISGLGRSTRATLLREEFRCDRELRCISLLWNRRLVFGIHIVVLKAWRPIGYRRPGHSGGIVCTPAAPLGAILGLGLLQLSFSRLVASSLGENGAAGN